MTTIECFLVEPTGRFRQALRRYAEGSKCPGRMGYHNASSPIEDADSRAGDRVNGDVHPHDDPRWPKTCECGYVFAEADTWQLTTHEIYRGPDGAECILSAPPVGAIWRMPWMEDCSDFVGADGRSYCMHTPGGDWTIDGPSKDGGHWTRTGEAPRFTVRPSIVIGGYHGFLTDGRLTPC